MAEEFYQFTEFVKSYKEDYKKQDQSGEHFHYDLLYSNNLSSSFPNVATAFYRSVAKGVRPVGRPPPPNSARSTF